MTAQLLGEESKINNVALILVNPQMGENIGAVARVMHNFNISDLRLVAPRDGWPNERAIAVSAGGLRITQNAKIFDNLQSAISDLHVVYACTARPRDINKQVVLPEEAALEFYNNKAIKIGIVAGPENSGLTNLDISFCNKIITIPVSEEYKSINIAQSLGIICYELFKNAQQTIAQPSQTDIASKSDLDGFLNSLIHSLEQVNFFKVENKKEKMIINLRAIFERITNISTQDVRTLYGVIKALTEYKNKD
jgi:tRNA/rRNA methyltransferase